ncbi:MAG: HAD family hydrolase [Alphaproteobacteria bacterium]
MIRPKAILFDFGGTLDADGLPWKERFHHLYRAEGVALDPEAFAPLFYAADDRLVGDLARSAGLRATIDQLTANLDPLLPNGSAERRARVGRRFIEDAQACLGRNRPILRALRAQCPLGIVSNFYGNLEGVCRETGLDGLIDVAVDSTVVGASKPEPRIFEAALRPLGVEAGACVFVGDSLHRDWVGAERLGMTFIWIEHPAMVKTGAARPRHSVPSLTRLPAILGLIDDAA